MRRLFATVALAICTCAIGCVASHRSGKTVSSAAIAPDDLPRHADPNAQYRMAAVAPRLIPRPSAADVANAQTCDPAVLSVDEIAAGASGNYRSVRLAFMNRGRTPCRLGGFPRIELLGPGGERIAGISVEKATSEEIVAKISDPSGSIPEAAIPAEATLMPEASAAFQIVWKTAPACPVVSGISVTAPGTKAAFSLIHSTRVCDDPVLVTRLWFDAGAV